MGGSGGSSPSSSDDDAMEITTGEGALRVKREKPLEEEFWETSGRQTTTLTSSGS